MSVGNTMRIYEKKIKDYENEINILRDSKQTLIRKFEVLCSEIFFFGQIEFNLETMVWKREKQKRRKSDDNKFCTPIFLWQIKSTISFFKEIFTTLIHEA